MSSGVTKRSTRWIVALAIIPKLDLFPKRLDVLLGGLLRYLVHESDLPKQSFHRHVELPSNFEEIHESQFRLVPALCVDCNPQWLLGHQ